MNSFLARFFWKNIANDLTWKRWKTANKLSLKNKKRIILRRIANEIDNVIVKYYILYSLLHYHFYLQILKRMCYLETFVCSYINHKLQQITFKKHKAIIIIYVCICVQNSNWRTNFYHHMTYDFILNWRNYLYPLSNQHHSIILAKMTKLANKN